MNMYHPESFMVSVAFELADGYNIPHYTLAHISMEAAAERKSPTVLEIYPLERQRLNAVKQRWRSILSEETWWLSENKDLN